MSTSEQHPSIIRCAEADVTGIDFAHKHPHRLLEWAPDGSDVDPRIAVIDEASDDPSADSPTFLLLHGEPTWSVLYERWIPHLTARGARVVAIDLPGFGRSDKPTADDWYSYERHCEAIRFVIAQLDLDRIHLVVQDWAGPIGLRQAVDDPGRYERIFIFNTWLHHADYQYSDGIRTWHAAATDETRWGGDMPVGRIVAGTLRRPGHDRPTVERTFDAPFAAGAASKAGPRSFPAMLPFAEPETGGAREQERCRTALAEWLACPIHLAFGDEDPVFPYDTGSDWAAEIPGATIDRIPGAGHFVQYDAPADCLDIVARNTTAFSR